MSRSKKQEIFDESEDELDMRQELVKVSDPEVGRQSSTDTNELKCEKRNTRNGNKAEKVVSSIAEDAASSKNAGSSTEKTDTPLDFGSTKVVKGKRGGKLLVYESQKYPGVKFHFRKLKEERDGQENFACAKCYEIRKSQRLQCSVPIAYVKNGRYIIRDPDQLPVSHICLPENDSLNQNTTNINKPTPEPRKASQNQITTTPKTPPKNDTPEMGSPKKRYRLTPKDFDKDFGEAVFTSGKNGAQIMVWESQLFPGMTFVFNVANKYPNGNIGLRCRACALLKKNYRLPYKVPYIFVRNGRVVGKNPDSPGNDHFCQEGMPNYPKIKNEAREEEDLHDDPETSANVPKTKTPDAVDTKIDECKNIAREVSTAMELIPPIKGEDNPNTPQQNLSLADAPNLDESMAKENTSISGKDFGATEILHDKKGHFILYDSVAYPGHTYRFQLYGYLKNVPVYYKCILCARKKQVEGLNVKIPLIIYRENRIVDRDPDCPLGVKHICVPAYLSNQKLEAPTNNKDEIESNGSSKENSIQPDSSSSNDFGPVEFVETKQGITRLAYDSKRIAGHQFHFHSMGGTMPNYYKCADCTVIKKRKGLECKIPVVKTDGNEQRFIEIDPDCPKNPHFCIQKSTANKVLGGNGTTQVKSFMSPIRPAKRRKGEYNIQDGLEKKPKIDLPLTLDENASDDINTNELALDVLVPSTSKLSVTNAKIANYIPFAQPRLEQPIIFLTSTENLPLEEYSYLTRKVQFGKEWTIEKEKDQLPCADRVVPARLKLPMDNFPRSEEVVRAQKSLKQQFDLAMSKFSNCEANTLMIVDSLYHTLDDTVFPKTAFVRAAFPVQPKWIIPHMMILCSMLEKFPTIVYGMGFDWILHSLNETPNYIANLVAYELEDIIDTMKQNRTKLKKADIKIIFITIPEIGDYQNQFGNFNQAMRILIHDKSKGLENCSLEILDWARFVEQAEPEKKETVDQRFKLLFDNK